MLLPDSHVMSLPDGRDLAWLQLGAPDGAPVMAFHGTPGSRLQMAVDDQPILAAGARVIAPDRPGYGLSSYHHGRRLADWPADVANLADHLGLDRFAVIGVSGGGPHAAVCARYMTDRVNGVGIVSGVAPVGDEGSEEGMMPTNQVLTRLARRSPSLVLPLFGLVLAIGRRSPERALESMRKQLPASDVAVLARPEVREAFIRDMRRAAPTAARAAAQDFALFTRDWGFRLEDITIPVHVWQGDDDRNVPAAHGRLQAERIPKATLHEIPGEGHMLVFEHIEEILRTVTAGA